MNTVTRLDLYRVRPVATHLATVIPRCTCPKGDVITVHTGLDLHQVDCAFQIDRQYRLRLGMGGTR